METEPRQAALSLVTRPHDGRVLAISRGRDTRDWGIPGGSMEPGETPELTARRELFEETGVEAGPAAQAECVYSAKSRRSHAFVFVYYGNLWVPRRLYSEPFEGFVEWLDPFDLLAPGCTYREFTSRLFSAVGISR